MARSIFTASSKRNESTSPRPSTVSIESQPPVTIPAKPNAATLKERRAGNSAEMEGVGQIMHLQYISFNSSNTTESQGNKPNMLKVYVYGLENVFKYSIPLSKASSITTNPLYATYPAVFKLGRKRLINNARTTSSASKAARFPNPEEAYLAWELVELSGKANRDLILDLPEGELKMRMTLSYAGGAQEKAATVKLYETICNNFRSSLSVLDKLSESKYISNDEVRHMIYLIQGVLCIPLRIPMENPDYDLLDRAVVASSALFERAVAASSALLDLKAEKTTHPIVGDLEQQLKDALPNIFRQAMTFFTSLSPSFEGWCNNKQTNIIPQPSTSRSRSLRPDESLETVVSNLQHTYPRLSELSRDPTYLYPPKSINTGKQAGDFSLSAASVKSISDTILYWIGNSTSQNVLFAYSKHGTSGYAGTCMTTLLPAFQALECLGAYAYLPSESRGEQSLIKLIHCLALQLCHHDDNLAKSIAKILETDPDILNANAVAQADALLGTALQTADIPGRTLPLLIMIGSQDKKLTALDAFLCRLSQLRNLRPFVYFMRFTTQESYDLMASSCHGHHLTWDLNLNIEEIQKIVVRPSVGKETEGKVDHILSTEGPADQGPVTITITTC